MGVLTKSCRELIEIGGKILKAIGVEVDYSLEYPLEKSLETGRKRKFAFFRIVFDEAKWLKEEEGWWDKKLKAIFVYAGSNRLRQWKTVVHEVVEYFLEACLFFPHSFSHFIASIMEWWFIPVGILFLGGFYGVNGKKRIPFSA